MADATKTLQVVIDAKDNATDTLNDFSKKIDSLSGKLRDMGAAMVALGAASTAGLIGATRAAIDFESSFAGVKKTVDLSAADFERLSDNFRNISKVTPLAINDLNRIGEIAGSLGVAGVDNLTKFTETIAKIGITTNLTEEEAAMSFGRIANIMQEPIQNVDRMGATVVDLGNKFAATEADITAFAERIAGAGKIAGLTTSDVFAIGTAMSSVGVEAEAGGTAVQKVLISMYQAATGSTSAVIDNSKAIASNTDRLADMQKSLSIATERQKEFGDKTKSSTKMANAAQIEKYNREIGQMTQELGALNATNGQAAISGTAFAKVLGLTNEEFKTMFKQSPTAIFEAFVQKLGQISKEGGDAAGVLEELDLSDQRLIRSFLSLSNAGDLLHNTIDTGRASWKANAALQTEAEKRYATTSAQIQIAKNNLYDLGITIGTILLPPLNQLLQSLKPVIEAVAAWVKEHPQLTVALLGFGAAIGVLGVALIGIATILPGLVILTTALGTAFAVTGGVIGTVIAILGGPLTIALVAIIALSAALALAWNTNWMDIQGKTRAVVDFIQARIQSFVDFLDKTVGPFMRKIFVQGILDGLDRLSGGWIGTFNGMRNAVEGLIGSLSNLINKAMDIGNKVKGGLKIPGFQHGGFVPGAFNQAVPAILHGGERVVPRTGTDVNPGMGGGAVNINISGTFQLDSDQRVNELADRVVRLLGRQNELAGKGIGI
jgi:hypothetical protein